MTNNLDTKLTLLIVDDQQINIKILADALSENYKVNFATNGDDAMGLIRDGLVPDMILLDVVMPDKDGFAVCKELKSNISTSAIPVIFITGMDDEYIEEQGLALGAVDYITKPLNMAVVKARIAMHLELQKHRQFLEKLPERRTSDLEEALSDAADLRDFIHERLI